MTRRTASATVRSDAGRRMLPGLTALVCFTLTLTCQLRLAGSQLQVDDCDGVEGSGKRMDRCGVCGGEDFGCKIVSGLFTDEVAGRGYVDIIDIPKGALNINITERSASRNYLVLISKDSQKSIINGDWTLSWSADYPAAGTVFSYSRPREGAGETIFARGPINEDIQVQMLSQAKNPGVIYEYAVPIAQLFQDFPSDSAALLLLDAAAAAQEAAKQLPPAQTQLKQTEKPAGAKERTPMQSEQLGPVFVDDRQPYNAHGVRGDRTVVGSSGKSAGYWPGRRTAASSTDAAADGSYQWKATGTLAACSATCGEGTQAQRLVCVKTPSMTVAPEEKCANVLRPEPPKIRCALPQCKARWEIGEWSECSVTCGKGTQSRVVECRRETSPGYSVAAPASSCVGKKPSAMQACRASPCSAWRVSNWTQCSVACGTGERTRLAVCEDPSGAAAEESSCPATRPRTTESCTSPCDGAWLYTEWEDQCSTDCAEGFLTRKVYCSVGGNAQDGADADATTACSGSPKPDSKRACKGSDICRQGRWFAGQWGECVGACAEAEQRRDVVCLRKVGYLHSPTYERDCTPQSRPESKRKCRPRSCDAESAEWFVTDYSACSATCGTGIRRREVRCLTREYSESTQCDETKRPREAHTCESSPCVSEQDCVDKHFICKAAKESGICTLPQYSSLCCASCSVPT